MSSWPDGVPLPPKPQKPEGITEQEWQVYLNNDPRKLPTGFVAKVHAALGWKMEDTADAEAIAGMVVRAVEKVDKDNAREALKGHVPEENMARYTRLRELSHLMSRMGNMVSGLRGQYEDANTLWAMGGKYKRMANELRVDRPDGGDTSQQPPQP